MLSVWEAVGPKGVCLQKSQGNNLSRENKNNGLQKIPQLPSSLLALLVPEQIVSVRFC